MALEQRARYVVTRPDGSEREQEFVWREYRVGLPLAAPYVWRGQRRPRFALEAIRRAEAEHGAPG